MAEFDDLLREHFAAPAAGAKVDADAVRARAREIRRVRWARLGVVSAVAALVLGLCLESYWPRAAAPVVLRTGPDQELERKLADETEVRLRPRTTAVCRGREPRRSVRQLIVLKSGSMEIDAPKSGNGEIAVRVETPEGHWVETLGTRFEVTRTWENQKGERNLNKAKLVGSLSAVLLVSVLEGQVRAGSGRAEVTRLAAGQDYVLGAGPVVRFPEKKPRILLEAEDAQVLSGGFAANRDAEASGGKYLSLPPKACDGAHHTHIAPEKDPRRTAGSGALWFQVGKEADYYLWVRRWTCCSCGDSWKMKFGGGKDFTFGNAGTTHRHWTWQIHRDADGRVKFRLKSGPCMLRISNRGESGFRIDQVLLTADPKFVPQGRETGAQRLREELAMKIYDVRDLLVEVPDFPPPVLGEAREKKDPPTAKKRPRIAVKKLLAGVRVAAPSKDPNCAVEHAQGKLVVVRTREGHARVAAYLARLRKELLTQVLVQARFVCSTAMARVLKVPKLRWEDGHVVDPKDLGAILKGLKGVKCEKPHFGPVRLDEKWKRVKGLFEGGHKAAVLFAPRVTCYNGQAAHVFVGKQVSYVSGYDREGAKIHKGLLGGAALGAKPTISRDFKSVTLELRPVVCDVVKMGEIESPKGRIQVPMVRLLGTRKTITVPDGSSAFLRLKTIKADPTGTLTHGVVALVTARILEFKEEEKL